MKEDPKKDKKSARIQNMVNAMSEKRQDKLEKLEEKAGTDFDNDNEAGESAAHKKAVKKGRGLFGHGISITIAMGHPKR